MIRSLLLEISEKEGLYAKCAECILRDPSYKDRDGLQYLKEIFDQSKKAVRESKNMFGQHLIDKIEAAIRSNEKEVITIKHSKSTKITRTIYGKPTSGTIGDFWLLVSEYQKLDPKWIDKKPAQWRQLVFNDQFMHHMMDQFGELHCEYCGRQHLKIFKWYDRPNKNTMCTVDHFYPRKHYPNLIEDPKNLFICCNRCNQNKKEKIIKEDEIKYRYDDSIRAKFMFDESKLDEKQAFKKTDK